jgi:hypothetical protein
MEGLASDRRFGIKAVLSKVAPLPQARDKSSFFEDVLQRVEGPVTEESQLPATPPQCSHNCNAALFGFAPPFSVINN